MSSEVKDTTPTLEKKSNDTPITQHVRGSERFRNVAKTLLRGFASAGLAFLAVTAPVTQAEHDGVTRNKNISEIVPGECAHPVDETTGTVWKYFFELCHPGLPGMRMLGSGTEGVLLLTGAGDVGVNIRTNSRFLDHQRGDAARPAIWVDTDEGTKIILMNANNEPIAEGPTTATGGGRAFGGFLSPEDNRSFGIRLVGASGVSRLTFGNISHEDNADPAKRNHPSVIDVAASLSQPEVAPVAPRPEAAPVGDAEVPGFVRVTDIQPGVWVRPASGEFGELQWNLDTQIRLGEGVLVRDAGVRDEMLISSSGRPITIDIRSIWLDQQTMNIIRLGNNGALKSLWLREFEPDSRVSGFVINEREELFLVRHFSVDGTGFGGVTLPSRSIDTRLEIADQRGRFGRFTVGNVSHFDLPRARNTVSVMPLDLLVP